MEDQDWDQFKSDRIKFEAPGTTIIGDIVNVTLDKGFGNGPIPLLKLKIDDEERELLAGQTGLQRQLAELKPKAGGRIKITYTGETALGGGKTFKNFEVSYKAPEAAPVAAATASNDDGEVF